MTSDNEIQQLIQASNLAARAEALIDVQIHIAALALPMTDPKMIGVLQGLMGDIDHLIGEMRSGTG